MAFVVLGWPGHPERLWEHQLRHLSQRARLLILAACDSGSVEALNFEGGFGMSRAALAAGARAVLAARWPIRDPDAERTISYLYPGLFKTGGAWTVAEAVRTAQLRTMNTSPHPFSWAGLGLIGDPR